MMTLDPAGKRLVAGPSREARDEHSTFYGARTCNWAV